MFSSHNGGNDLTKMLDGLTKLQVPAGGWKLIAVDNASTDGSGEIMRSYADRLPITVLYEPVNGKNRALNLALDHAEGDFYILTDDDVIVRDDWLVRWRDAADSQTSFDLFAGFTRSILPYQPPRWILDGVNVGVLYASHEGMQEGPCHVYSMFGTNMAIRASVFQTGVRFSTEIGPDGSPNYAMGSETELGLRLQAQGYKCWFTAGPIVEHIVHSDQLEKSWILKRGYRWGRGWGRMGIPYHCPIDVLARKNTLKTLVYPLLLPFLPKHVSWRRQWQLMVDRGYEDGARQNDGLKLRWVQE